MYPAEDPVHIEKTNHATTPPFQSALFRHTLQSLGGHKSKSNGKLCKSAKFECKAIWTEFYHDYSMISYDFNIPLSFDHHYPGGKAPPLGSLSWSRGNTSGFRATWNAWSRFCKHALTGFWHGWWLHDHHRCCTTSCPNRDMTCLISIHVDALAKSGDSRHIFGHISHIYLKNKTYTRIFKQFIWHTWHLYYEIPSFSQSTWHIP